MNRPRVDRRAFVAGLAALAATVHAAPPQPTDDPAASEIWQKVRASLFENKPIADAPAGLLTLEAPARAIDSAVVPVAIRTRLPAGDARRVERLYLIIDSNPSPISAIFQFGPDSGRAEVETRVRVDGYSFVRAIAQLSDGRLYATTRFVKASGGCSAPPGSDAAAALASMGRMHVRVDGDVKGREPVLAQLTISHPNHSGLAMDQVSRQFTPAHYVRKVEVSHDGKPVFSADVDFSMSENPSFRFYFVPNGNGALQASVTDSRGLQFTALQAAPDARP
jgi:sulfur-oxidizing protein SoxY